MERPIPLRRLSVLNNGKTRGKRGETEEGGDSTKKKSKKKKEERPEVEVAPEFVVKPRRQFIDVGGVAKFKASFDGPSSTQLYWSKGGTVIVADEHFKIYEDEGFHHLEVLNVTAQDSGEFSVTVLNPAGSDTAMAELEVFERPQLLTTQMPEWEKPLEDLVVRQGDTAVEITCCSKGLKNPTVRWYLNDQELFSGFHTQLQHEGQLVTLTIKDIRETDAGQVRCVMTGVNGELESACSVVVRPPEKMEPPVFVMELHDMEVEEGDKLELDVRVKGSAPVEVFWFHNNVAITRDSPHFLLASLDQSLHTLTIPRATRECSGEFVCEAYNAFGDTDTFCLVNVQEVDDPEPPSFVARPLTLLAQEGEAETLTCRVRGHPEPSVMWERQGVVISPCDKYQINTNGDSHSLIINHLESTDAGLYVCHLHSVTGSASHTCELRVEQSQRRSWTVLSKTSREPLESGSEKRSSETCQSTNGQSRSYKGVNPDINSRQEGPIQPIELSDFEQEQTFRPSDRSNSTEDPIKSPPTPKPRSFKINGSQAVSGTINSDQNKEESSFVFPMLKTVSGSSGISDKSNGDSEGPQQTDFRSVLKPRSLEPSATNRGLAGDSEATTDFRSVLSKPKSRDRDLTITPGGFPRSDPVGVELRNLQMTRTSRNVASRGSQPKFGVASLLESREPLSQSLPLSRNGKSHVNTAGLRMVSKNLDTLDPWEQQRPSGEITTTTARGVRQWRKEVPSYSPSSCASTSQQDHDESSPSQADNILADRDNKEIIAIPQQEGLYKAVPRFPPNNSSKDNTHQIGNSRDHEISQAVKSTLPRTIVGQNCSNLNGDSSDAQNRENIFVTGLSKSRGSIKLAERVTFPQKQSFGEHKFSMRGPSLNKVSGDIEDSEKGVRPKTLQKEQDDIPPPLPSSLPPPRSLTETLDDIKEAKNSGITAKCVSVLEFTPTPILCKTPDAGSTLEPVTFNFALPDSSSSSPKLAQATEEKSTVSEENTTGVSDTSREENDDVFIDHLETAEVERRGSIKVAGSVFAWEKLPSKSPETSPFCEASKEQTEARNDTKQAPATKKRTCFKSDFESGSHTEANKSVKFHPSSDFQHKSLSSSQKTPPSSSKPKSVSSAPPDAEFTKIKLKSTGAKIGSSNDLKKSRFLSTSTESLFFNVKLKPVHIKEDDIGEESSLSKNSFSIRSKSKSSGDLLRDSRSELLSSSSDEVQSARERSGFSEKLSAFENIGSKTDRTDLSKKPNFTIPKRNAISKFVSDANKKETEKQQSNSKPSFGSPPARTGFNSNSSSKPIAQFSVPQPKQSSTLPNNHRTPATSQVLNETGSTFTRSRHSVDISSRMENVPTWVKEKALGKRASLSADTKAATLPISPTSNVQNTRDRISKLKENPDAPKTPRRFQRDKPQTEDQLSRTLGNDELPRTSLRQNNHLKGDVKGVNHSSTKATVGVDKTIRKPWARHDPDHSVPEWIQRRNLKPVVPSSSKEAGKESRANTHSKELPSDISKSKSTAQPFSSLISKFNQTAAAAEEITNRTNGDSISNNERSKIENKMLPVDSSITRQTTEDTRRDAGRQAFITESHTHADPKIIIEPSHSPNPVDILSSNSNNIEPKSVDLQKQSEVDSSHVEDKHQNGKDTSAPSRFTPPKQVPTQEAPIMNNQPSLRNTAVRPAWKKQRSLRHIPIYPIHDNELSPRYEPFIDDSESTASISSTSSEASIVTNDSGYNSRSRANTSELLFNKPQLTKDHLQYHRQHDNEEHLKHENGENIEASFEVRVNEAHLDKETEKGMPGEAADLDTDCDDIQTPINSASTIVDHHLHSTIQPEIDTPDLLCNKSRSEDTKTFSTHNLTTFTTNELSKKGEGISLDERSKSLNLQSQIQPHEKELSDSVKVSSEPFETTSNSTNSRPTRQSLDLKNKVSYLDTKDETSEEPEEAPLPVTFPRRRSKFMDDYLNGRRGSEETTQVPVDAKPGPDLPDVTKQPPAKRPSDLDIGSKWKRSQPASDSLATSAKSHSDVGDKDTLSSNTAKRTELRRGLAADAEMRDLVSVPIFTKSLPETIEVMYGSKTCLACSVSGYPTPDVDWLFNRQPLKLSKTQSVSRDGSEVALTLTETFAEHEGVYTCRASNSEGSVETSCVLTLAVSEKSEGGRAFEGPVSLPPRITSLTPKVVSLTVGSPLTLTATFTGEPPPTVDWILAGREIVADERIHLDHQRGTSSLTIDSVQRSHSGKMSVCVSSGIGTDQAAVNICLEDVPDAPIGKPQVYDLGRTSASLSWCGPSSSGGNNVTHYSIEARTRQNGHNWDVVVAQCKELTCHILDLKPCMTYQFRVRAANRHGLGPPSEPSDKVTTFDLFTSPSDNESDGFNEVFSPSIEYRKDELPFEPRQVTFNTTEKFESVYDLDKEVGKGKFGTVYKCRHRKDGTTWAAKVVKCRPRDKAALRMEVDIMNKLRHPKLLMLWDAFESDRQMVLVMEFVGAGELFERVIGEDFVLTERDCVHFLRQICEGVQYMHTQCVLHLDLKPENILCLSESSNRIKIIDFGLARHHNPGESTKVLFGTPEFIAPEVINYDEIGFATDMWSIGVICYVLLSGLSPFLGDTDTETLSLVTSGEFDFDDEAFDEISDQAKDFISKLLVKRKEKRLLTSDCLQHSWLNQDEVDGARYKRLNTDRLKRFMVRRKWLKTGNAVLAVSRLMKTTSILSRLGSSQSTSEENLLELSMDSAGGHDQAFSLAADSTDDESQLAANSGVFPDEDGAGTGKEPRSNDLQRQSNNDSVLTNCAETSIGGDTRVGGSDSNNNDNSIENRPAGRNTNTGSSVTQGHVTLTPQASAQAPPSSLALPSLSPWKHASPLSDSQNQSTLSTQRSDSSVSVTSSLASPIDAHQHPCGLIFTKLMSRCKACKGDAARFDVTISGSPGPLRLSMPHTNGASSSESSEFLVSWYFDGELVVQDDHRHMSGGGSASSGGGNFSLVIRSVCEEDEGEYSCRVHSTSLNGEEMLLCCRADLAVLNV